MIESIQNIKGSLLVLIIWMLMAWIGPLFVAYEPAAIDLSNAGSIGPFDKQQIANKGRHWLGTDELGRDALSQLVYGSRTALWVGFGSVLLSALIGILLGSLPAYYGDKLFKINRRNLWMAGLLSFFFLLYSFLVIPWKEGDFSMNLLLFAFLFLLIILFWSFAYRSKRPKNTSLPLDLILGRVIEVMDSLPILFIIISLSAVIEPSISGLILIIGISNWSTIARYARSETLAIKEQAYIESARAVGQAPFQILLKHILPNALGPTLVTLSFGVAAAILIESTLSFLGIGIGVEDASWGAMMAEGRKDPSAWWLILPPGMAIFSIVYSCNKIGDSFRL